MSAQSLDELLEAVGPTGRPSPHHFPFLQLGVVLAGVALLGSAGLYAFYLYKESQINLEPMTVSAQSAELIVDVSGAVVTPGLYHLAAGARVNDAVLKAGGLVAQANKRWVSQSLNLAGLLTDGQKIYIPFEGEVQGSSTADMEGFVNLNTAGAKELETLPGIGPAMAEKIMEYRTEHGPFKNWEEVEAVPGIGPALIAKMQEKGKIE